MQVDCGLWTAGLQSSGEAPDMRNSDGWIIMGGEVGCQWRAGEPFAGFFRFLIRTETFVANNLPLGCVPIYGTGEIRIYMPLFIVLISGTLLELRYRVFLSVLIPETLENLKEM